MRSKYRAIQAHVRCRAQAVVASRLCVGAGPVDYLQGLLLLLAILPELVSPWKMNEVNPEWQ